MVTARRSPVPLLPLLLGVLTLLALYASLAASALEPTKDPRLDIIFIGLVAFVVNVELPLIGDSISLGYAAGLLIYLILGNSPSDAFGVITVGAILGGLLRAGWIGRVQPNYRQFVELPLISLSRLALSMLGGDLVFRLLGGNLPLIALHGHDVMPLTGL